jgi:hypothetical protein
MSYFIRTCESDLSLDFWNLGKICRIKVVDWPDESQISVQIFFSKEDSFTLKGGQAKQFLDKFGPWNDWIREKSFTPSS